MSANATSEEKRRFHRVLFDIPCTIHNQSGSWDTRVIDFSLNGALVQTPDGWTGNVDDVFELSTPLDSGDRVIRMEVAVSHSEDAHLGLHCTHIDVDSISHLRRLVELNLGDMSLLERDLSALVSP